MSRIRPYGNFNEAYYMLKQKHIKLDNLFEYICTFIEIKHDMKLPYRDDWPEELLIFWQLLSYLWGTQYDNVWQCVVPYENLQPMLESIQEGIWYANN